MKNLLKSALILSLFTCVLHAEENSFQFNTPGGVPTPPPEESQQVINPYPVFLSDLPNPNDYSLFANGGWDGNWYVGYNTCWMQKIPAPPAGNYKRAFIGAKLGRMKNLAKNARVPWDRKAFAGEIYMAANSTPSWNRSQSYFLTSTEFIPFEADDQNAIEGTGEAQWFWAEVPIKKINLEGDTYLALWSITESINSVSSGPILAAGWGTKDVNSWVSHDIKGTPPNDPVKAISTPITIFEPAIALKLIPEQLIETKPVVRILKIETGKVIGRLAAPKVVSASVEGDSIQRVWLEISLDGENWKTHGHILWKAPYTFTVKMENFPIGPDGKTWIRIGATDVFENSAYCDPVNLFESGK